MCNYFENTRIQKTSTDNDGMNLKLTFSRNEMIMDVVTICTVTTTLGQIEHVLICD